MSIAVNLLERQVHSRFANKSKFNDENRLVRRIEQRDQKTIFELSLQYKDAVYKFALFRLKNSAFAHEILNEVMFDIWQYAWRYTNQGKLKNWILSIAHNKIVDKIRHEIRFQRDNCVEYIFRDNTDTPESILARTEENAIVANALDQLTDEHKAVIHLAFYDELPYQDIAAIIGCPENTVKTRVHYAKKKLKKILSQNLCFSLS